MKITLALLFGLGLMAGPSEAGSANESKSTLNNLQTAFYGECNAHERYVAFATKADQEGYAGVASLFRAAARAEEIHANNHAAVIRELGAMPRAKLEQPIVGTTIHNLEIAIKGETSEANDMYPSFIQKAAGESMTAAVRTFDLARAAEVENAKLFSDALQNLETLTAARVFYVCPKCGFTAREPVDESCPSCATPKEQFEEIS